VRTKTSFISPSLAEGLFLKKANMLVGIDLEQWQTATNLEVW
jgi:hypothetical protein